MTIQDIKITQSGRIFTAAEMGMLAHVYRAEVYRSTTWRTRLDATTNWAVVTLGIGVSVTFSSAAASPLPLILTGLITLFLLMLEGRRYRYFNVWRARARWMETHLIAPLLEDGDLHCEENWQAVLARDYHRPLYHISFVRAVGRRLRSNFIWIFMIVAVAYVAKIAVHPLPISTWAELPARAAIGPFSGWAVLAVGLVYNGTLIAFAAMTLWLDRIKHRGETSASSMG
ncbi:UCP01500/DUF2270 family protein [Octadecabacter arcticus 238]|uniref:UCP01500/DUF2270 family protein n=1 Tax=Octadecabacter arcticus 238 TaxID=391616 RepID=M9RXI9_9RHOB|nr:DUF2270 domain-containing protein [Octadecabacter arcticus]AGI74595.1 UCP01500/DUF2270 family protein [Octadecabacter arcticus 238]